MEQRCVNCNQLIADDEVAIETPHGLQHERRCTTDDNPAARFGDDGDK